MAGWGLWIVLGTTQSYKIYYIQLRTTQGAVTRGTVSCKLQSNNEGIVLQITEYMLHIARTQNSSLLHLQLEKQ